MEAVKPKNKKKKSKSNYKSNEIKEIVEKNIKTEIEDAINETYEKEENLPSSSKISIVDPIKLEEKEEEEEEDFDTIIAATFEDNSNNEETIEILSLEKSITNIVLDNEIISENENTNINEVEEKSEVPAFKNQSNIEIENITSAPVLPESTNMSKQISVTKTTQLVSQSPITVNESIELVDTTEYSPEEVNLIRPFTEQQLSALYQNEELEIALKEFINEFIEVELRSNLDKNHYLYELLTKYLHSKTKLVGIELELNGCRKESTDLENKIWIVKEIQKSKKGECQDDNSVTATHNYNDATFQKSAFETLCNSLSRIKDKLHNDYALHSYSVNVLKLQIEHYIQCLINKCQINAELAQNSPVKITENGLPLHLLQELRLCLSVLFAFQRRNITDKIFLEETRHWIEKLVAVLLRVASWRDHLFLLHHILRCPNGISNWAAHFIQVPCSQLQISSAPFSDPCLNHIVTVVAIILLPVTHREAFLSEFLESWKESRDNESDSLWVVVDSDGESDDVEVTGTMNPMRETDIVSLLNQIPLGSLFRNLLRVSIKDNQDVLNISEITESHILKLLSWSSQWIRLLGCGMHTYSTSRYRQLTKLLSRFINYTVQYVTELWCIFCSTNTLKDDAMMKRLQIEYDALFIRATQCIYSSQSLGAWQFLAVMPFEAISTPALWMLYYMIYDGYIGVEILSSDKNDKNEIQKKLSDISFKHNFEEKIMKLPDAEVYYLLQAFANMALARTLQDRDFIQIITNNLLYIGFICSSTRENYSKQVRDLLISLTIRHPNLISSLLLSIHEHISQMGQLCLYLFKELPLHLWIPTEEDFELLAQILIHNEITSYENNLARLILAHLNWNFIKYENNDVTFLPHHIHVRIALLLVNATMKHYNNGMVKGSDISMIWENWVWKFALRLRLHFLDQDLQTVFRFFSDPGIVMRTIPESHPHLLSAINEKQPLASLISLLTTHWGHSVPLICNHGFQLLQNLINSTRYNEVIFTLHLIVPLFLTCIDSLLNCDKFKEVIVGLFNADKGYVKMAKNLIIEDQPGPVVQQFGNMIQKHLNEFNNYLLENPTQFVILWLKVITSVDNWQKDNNCLYIIDIILKTAFFHCTEEAKEVFQELLHKQIQSNKNTSQGTSGISSLFSWMSNSVSNITLLTTTSGNYVWLAYFLLDLEHHEFEVRTGLWKELLIQLSNSTGKTNIDNSLKKTAAKCNVPYFGSSYLSIYRLAQQALITPLNHPILPLVWQKFFFLYLTRVPVFANQTDRGGVGNKFFDGVINLNFLKKLKKRLQETISYFNNKIETSSVDSLNFLENLKNLFTTYLLWLEESKLHESSVFLHILPPNYLPNKLLLIFEKNDVRWNEFIDYDQIATASKISSDEWLSLCYRNQVPRVVSPIKGPRNHDEYLQVMMRRLHSYDTPLPPPILPKTAPFIPNIPLNAFTDINKMMSLIKPKIKIITSFAQSYAMRVSEHTALNCSYCENLPQLYQKTTKTVKIKTPCKNGRNSGSQKAVHCSGPAIISIEFVESIINQNILHQIRNNRSEYDNLLKRCFNNLPHQLCIASVFIEHLNNTLQSEYVKYQLNNDVPKIESIQKVAVEYFYFLTSVITDEIKFYAPAQLLFKSCTTKLGQTFISGWDIETIRLINTVIQKPKLVDTLAVLLNPPIQGANFLPAYTMLTDHVGKLTAEVTFLLITKFDVEKWLSTKKPRLKERSDFIKSILSALVTLGYDPKPEFNLLHELLRNHLMLAFCHEWPEHYGEVLQCVLRSSIARDNDDKTISVTVWKDILKTLGYRNNTGQSFTEELRHYATTQNLLQYNELVESANLLGHHFTQERLQFGLYGLYPRYRYFIEPITTLLAMFGHALVVSTMQKYPRLLGDKLCEMIWPTITDMYSPWLTPYWAKNLKDISANWIQQLSDGRTAILPWTHADVNYAQKMISAFVNNIRFIMDMLPANTILLNYVWQYYAINFAHIAIKEHILSPVHTALLVLPWDRFWPSLQDLEIMLKITDQYLPDCHVFTGFVVMKINWTNWLEMMSQNDNSLIFHTRVQQCLLSLFVKLAFEPRVQQQNSKQIQSILTQAFRFSWSLVDAEMYEQLINWYIMSCDPKAILKIEEKCIIDYLILDLLQASSEYIASDIGGRLGIHTYKKRIIFIKGYTKLLSTSASRNKQLISTENVKFRKVISQVLDEMELILKNSPCNPVNQLNEACGLLTEFLVIVDDKNLSVLACETLSNWLSNRTENSTVLLGVLSILGTVPQCLASTGKLLEASLTGYFNISNSNWSNVTKILQGRNLWTSKKLPEIMAQDGNILSLHALILVRKENTSISLSDLVDWMDKIKPNKIVESKLPLILCDIFNLVVPLSLKAIEDDDTKTITEIRANLDKLIKCLNRNADEKSGWGSSLLGAMGIKNNTDSATNRCRLLCRSVALYIKAQILDKEPLLSSLRCKQEDLEKQNFIVINIDNLRSYSQNEIKVSVDTAIKQIHDRTNSLHNINEFIMFLSQQLYNNTYIKNSI